MPSKAGARGKPDRLHHRQSERRERRKRGGRIDPPWFDAVNTAKGREKIAEWIKLLENATAKHLPGNLVGSYGFGWIWRELGIEEFEGVTGGTRGRVRSTCLSVLVVPICSGHSATTFYRTPAGHKKAACESWVRDGL